MTMAPKHDKRDERDYVRLNRTTFSHEWEVAKVDNSGVITQRWPLHPDDAKVLEEIWKERNDNQAGD